MPLDIPAQRTYATEADFVKTINIFTASKGYALVIGRSYTKKGLRTAYYQCDRAGTYRDRHGVTDENRQKNRGSRLCGCKVRVRLQEQVDGSYILLRDLSLARSEHNHELSTVSTVHPSLRRLDDATRKDIERQVAVGVTPKQILALQHAGPSGVPPLARDIYNLSSTARRKANHCLEPPEALLKYLSSEQYSFVVQSEAITPSTSRMTGLIFSHPSAILLTRRYHLAITIDATYKTNKYSMPFVHFVGLTATSSTFCSAVALVTREREEDYFWVLEEYKKMMGGIEIHVVVTDRDAALGNALARVFPQAQHNLCRWHINKNIVTNCKRAFPEEDAFVEFQRAWNQVVGAASEAEYETMIEAFLAALDDLPDVREYITGLLDVKEKYISAWADKHLHLGSTSSSRVEGAHRSFKTFLGTSVGDLSLVGRRVHDHLVLQQRQVFHSIENDKRNIGVKIGSISLFAEVRGKVSAFATNLAYEQMVLANRYRTMGLLPCTTTFTSSMGIPCAHIIAQSLLAGTPLSMAAFNKQWWLDINIEPTPITQRLVAPVRPGGPSSSRTNTLTGTQRIPSAFERVEAEGRLRRPATCSRCGNAGHNSRNTHCPSRTPNVT
ncbi:hypothetical protein CF326_g4990 [Tilletia indica]|nr:hypothetical protein CF326_g4990 [Tilletia indica]